MEQETVYRENVMDKSNRRKIKNEETDMQKRKIHS